MANIKYQFLQAINASFKENMDKHSIKKVEGASNKIFSYSARKNVLNVASDFAKLRKKGIFKFEKPEDAALPEPNSKKVHKEEAREEIEYSNGIEEVFGNEKTGFQIFGAFLYAGAVLLIVLLIDQWKL